MPHLGSYLPEDCTFLLRPLQLSTTSLQAREQAIQSGQAHYSEMIGPEDAPTRARMRLFREALTANGPRFAQDLVTLAARLMASGRDLTLVSIARAGTPVGVLLQRIIRASSGWAGTVRHYSISVIRDRGVDAHALRHITARHDPASIRFLDGWTGKGTIAHELATSLTQHLAPGTELFSRIPAALWVPLDISGSAGYAASEEDYLLPSSLLGGTVSGLVSRSILPRSDVGEESFHGCVELSRLRRYDVSRSFVDHIEKLARPLRPKVVSERTSSAKRYAESHEFISKLMEEFCMTDRNRVKIGIGETVRVALRRLPERILLRENTTSDALFILRLASLRDIPVEHRPGMPHAAVGIIATVLASP